MTTGNYLRWGIAGLGSGAMNLLEGFSRNPHVRITAAADIRKEALEAFGREVGAETYTSVEEMCQSPNVDAVWVATPNHLHAPHVIAAAENGKHATVSKPMAITLQECEAMNQAAERNGVVLLSGHTQSMLPGVQRMAELVWSGQYGKLAMVHSWHYNDWMYRPRVPYELDVSQGGGLIYRQSPHHIDIVRLIGGGLVKSVRAMTMELDPRRPCPGAFTAYLEFADRTPCTLVYSGYGRFDSSEITFGGSYSPGRVTRATSVEEEAAMKEARRYTAGTRIAPTPPPSLGERPGERAEAGAPDREEPLHRPFGLTIASCERADVRQSPRGLWVYDEAGKHEIEVPRDRLRGEAELEEMYQAVVNKRRAIHDGRWGEATHEVTMAIMESARTGKEVFLTHQVQVPAEAMAKG